MPLLFAYLVFSVLALCLPAVSMTPDDRPTTVDGRVVQMKLPAQELRLSYIESRSTFTVELAADVASVQAEKMYIGDGTIAIELRADSTNGIFLQDELLQHGTRLEKQAVVKVKPGYKQATELKPGDVYVVLAGVNFEL